jgi:hypothetical protein
MKTRKGTKHRIRLEIDPPAGRVRQSVIRVLDCDTGRTLFTDSANLNAIGERDKAARRLVKELAARGIEKTPEEIGTHLAESWAAAVDAQRQAPAAAATGPTVRDVVVARVPTIFRFSFRTERGAWSEARAAEVTRASFLAETPEELINAAALASDVPRTRDGRVTRAGVLRAVKAELEILWPTLLAKLPPQAEAIVDGKSPSARCFREAIVVLWTKLSTHRVSKTSTNKGDEVTASRSSLISRVLADAKWPGSAPTCGWREVQAGFHAFWRVDLVEGGELVLRLAMRWTLGQQLGVTLPGVHCERELNDLAERYSLKEMAGNVKARLTGGGKLLVLSQDVTQELAEQPEREADDEQTTEAPQA